MNTTPDLNLLGVALLNGRPLACTGCGNTLSLEVHKRGLFETGPAWVSCLACGHGDDSHPVTNGLVDAVLAGWVQRQKNPDRDTFTAGWRGTVLAGELMPTFDVHQAVGAAKAVKEAVDQVAAPEVKRWWRSKKKAAKAQVKDRARAVKGKVGAATGTAKATAIGAAWTIQTGGAGAPAPKKPRARCRVKGCRGGWLTITTRVHSSTGKAQQRRVQCAVCRRAD